MNGTQPSSCYRNPTIGVTFAFCLIFLVSLAGNTIIGIIVYKRKTMRKPLNFLIVNMAMSDLLVPIFSIPRDIQLLCTNSWLIGDPLGEALWKLVNSLPNASFAVSIQSLTLIAVDRFGAVHFSFVFHSSVQTSARSLFSPLGSSQCKSIPQIVPQILASVLFSVEIIVQDLRLSYLKQRRNWWYFLTVERIIRPET